MKTLLIILANLYLFSSYNSILPKKFEKKINKDIIRIWDEPITKKLIQIPDSLKFNTHHLLFELKSSDSLVGILSLNRVNACKIGGCDANSTDIIANKYEHFYYAVILNENLKILRVNILEYESDYGYEITSKGWLRQFIGKRGNDISYKNEIDAISGATVSAYALVYDLQMLSTYLTTIKPFIKYS